MKIMEEIKVNMENEIHYMQASILLKVCMSFATPLCIHVAQSELNTSNPFVHVMTMEDASGDRATEVDGHYYFQTVEWQQIEPGMWKCPVDKEALRELFSASAQLQVAVYPEESPMGLDGDSYEIHIRDGGSANAHWSWGTTPPKGWEGLDDLARRMMAMVGI